jgi:ZIP family zinc transporter
MSETIGDRSANLGAAILLATVAGGASAIGGAIVFSEKYIQYASSDVMAKMLAFTCGVMLVVGQFYLLHESLEEGGDADLNGGEKYAVAWASFFAGMLAVKGIDFVVHRFLGVSLHADVSVVKKVMDAPQEPTAERTVGGASAEDTNACSMEEGTARTTDVAKREKTRLDLKIAGLNGAFAIALHNIPEGIITFFAALKDPSVGALLALAIAIHNIPEGVGVAIPLYYADGSRWKAFGWCCLSGVAEPVGALLAYAAIEDAPSHLSFAIIYGLCSGVIVEVIFHDILIAAMKYAKDFKDIYNGVAAGVVFMGCQFMLYKGLKQVATA